MRRGGVALVAGAFLVVFGFGGLRLIFGVWMRPLEADFQVDWSSISLVAALSLLVLGLGQPLLGRLVDVRGPRIIGLLVGLLVIAHQTGAALGSFLAGGGYELLGGYPPVMTAGVGVALTAALLAFSMDTRPVQVDVGSRDGAGLALSHA